MMEVGTKRPRLDLPPPPEPRPPRIDPLAQPQAEAVPGGSPDPVAASHPPSGDASEDEDLQELPNDTLAALQLLCAQFPKPPKGPGTVPFAMRSQLYSLVKDPTEVDKQLDDMRLRHQIRLLKLPCNPDNCAVVQTSDYVAAIAAAAARLQQQQQQQGAAAGSGPNASANGHDPSGGDADGASAAAALADFVERVLPACTGVSASRAQVVQLMASQIAGGGGHPAEAGLSPCAIKARRVAAADAAVSALLATGFMVRDTQRFGHGLLFALPGAGTAVSSIIAGRKELANLMRRERSARVLLSKLKGADLASSRMGTLWHIRDLLGSGVLLRSDTPAGAAVHISRR